MNAMNAVGGCTKESKLNESAKTTQIQHKTRQKLHRIEENVSIEESCIKKKLL